ncbi:MAG: hypothetical protein HFH48_05840, partial [Lachnospiraceae bacterium]|nr:hypothetical protein [Lachnospiraceae bacterium]
MREKNIWKICLMFDLCCLCLIFGMMLTGRGKGEEMKQALQEVIKIQEGG